MRRRAFLTKVGALSIAGTSVSTVGGGRTEQSATEPAYTILSETEHATDVFVREGGSGPTALIVGGMHGDEKSGYRAATDIAEWRISGGTLVVLPKANQVAIRANSREGKNGDLNRQFPTGEQPETELAQAIWGVVSRHDPDVVLDLHRSIGIYGYHESSVGQVIWPTNAEGASEYAKRTAEYLNESVVPWSMPLHAFRRGGEITGSRPMLVHRVAGELNRAGYLFETTEFFIDSNTRVRWTKKAAEDLLSRHGIERSVER
ncbi:succinylglutamate desuccinylase/aspartoacylase family protein [Haladaptatus pallidirubidus]|uniref:Succinylglutamate desuccinylase/Aspartoacylase catalytic domain-containing protein n=1 Tax=Haladaptatus pallidirubidus TaxID=1008152 RepID=A0AAV3UBG2_9EURY|nr:succinylglutamate desuccinylase/aspartoacylase family protein [Haladaptatus pallidirubidus]